MIKQSRTKEQERGHGSGSAADTLHKAGGSFQGVISADPHQADQPTDDVTVMTQRQLNRIVYVATEAGCRFGRQASLQAASWMVTPWPLLDCRPAHSACKDRELFERAMWLHKTMAPLLVTPNQMLERLAEGGLTFETPAAVRFCGTRASLADLGLGKVDLFTATIVDEDVSGHVHIFAAFLAVDEQEARDRLEVRLGASLTSLATICRGFDPSEPIASYLLSEAVAHTLGDIAQEPTSSIAAGLDLFVEHRFAA